MHLFTLYAIIKATSPMSLIASLVASSNLFCIILYLSIAVLFAGNKSTTNTWLQWIGQRQLQNEKHLNFGIWCVWY